MGKFWTLFRLLVRSTIKIQRLMLASFLIPNCRTVLAFADLREFILFDL